MTRRINTALMLTMSAMMKKVGKLGKRGLLGGGGLPPGLMPPMPPTRF